jgi:glutamate/tyrosine decarboxylase-like PLP-dependent enzyme
VLGLSWQSSPSVTEVEEVVTDWLRQMLGLSPAWGGVRNWFVDGIILSGSSQRPLGANSGHSRTASGKGQSTHSDRLPLSSSLSINEHAGPGRY